MKAKTFDKEFEKSVDISTSLDFQDEVRFAGTKASMFIFQRGWYNRLGREAGKLNATR